ncbi:MAG: hypothetical protein ACHQ50_06215 [Fimbriimonadales bacterium]
MKFQDTIIDAIQHSYDEAFKYAKATASDKLDWKPLDAGRSVLDQLQELAQAPDYVTATIAGDPGAQDHNPERWAKLVAERQAWTTVEDCEREAKTRLGKLFDAIRNCSDQRLQEKVWLPYDGGRDFTIQEICDYPRWNAVYHLGQICYIQILYGDKEMH